MISPSFLMAHFDDVYAEEVGWEKSAMTEPTTMMEPPLPPAIMCRAAALQQWCAENCVTERIRMVVSQLSSCASSVRGRPSMSVPPFRSPPSALSGTRP